MLSAAREHFSDLDAIINPYDLSFVWVSYKYVNLTEFSDEELVGNPIFRVCPRYMSPEEIENNLMMERPIEQELPIITKSGKNLKFKWLTKCITFEEKKYCIGKILEVIEQDQPGL